MQVCLHCGTACNDDDRFCAACGNAFPEEGAASDPMVGRTVGGSYTLKEMIGVGGMGRVYRAEQALLGRTVAVKVIHPHLLGDEHTVARFYNEARAASRLNHPNSVGIIDFGRTDDGVLYLAMEHITGKDLAIVMHEDGPLPFPRICEILVGVLDALGEAHALGVIHRDLKPENVILRRFRSGSDLVKVVDFGLATIVGGADTSITRPGLVCGTPDYMAPEQGRGEAIDGRADLYSLGVVLYELLTEQLPFEDETPTKVVLRHINDPVPDPRKVAPHRQIPDALADVVFKALAKSPAHRYQSAEEFQAELKELRFGFGERERQTSRSICAACGAENPASMRFCGSCGARLTGRVSVPEELRPRSPSLLPAERDERPFTGRAAELERLLAWRNEAMDAPVRVHVTGEPGVGKTRLLRAAAQRLDAHGDLVVWTGPHPSGAPVPYAPVRTVLAALLGVAVVDLARLVETEGVLEDPLTRAGVRAVAGAAGASGGDGVSRTAAVAVSVSTAVRVALGRSDAERVVVVVDDLDRCDGLSQQVFAALPGYLPEGAIVLLSAGANRQPSVDGAHTLELDGLDMAHARQFMDGHGSTLRQSIPAPPGRTTFLPLYLEQVEALGLGSDDLVPARLADVLAQRTERLDVSALRILQAAAVLGYRTDLEALGQLAEGTDMRGLEALRATRLVGVDGDRVEIVHPFIRDLVEASIPAEVRRQLHQRAMRVVADREEPLEVRADHAYRAGEPMSALVLLERMGDTAMERGDALSAVLAFRRGLELARREMLETGESTMDRALVTFSRKLGEALERTGDVTGADGVLREALDLTGPTSRERALLLVSLGAVADRRGRGRDASRILGQALEIAVQLGDHGVEGRVQLALARVRRQAGDGDGAVAAYRRAIQELEAAGVADASCVQAGVELAEVLLVRSNPSEAGRELQRVLDGPASAAVPAWLAAALGMLGTLDEQAGDRERAALRYEEAAQLAARAGDAEGHGRWRRRAAALAA